MKEMTTESNQGVMVDGEYIETIENTPFTFSIIHMKTDDIDQGDLLLSAQCLLSQNVCADEASNFSKGSRNISEAYEKSYKDNFMETLRGGRKGEGSSDNRSLKDLTTEANLEDLVDGEYIKTTENTPSTSSTTLVKKEDSDKKDLLRPSHNVFNQNIFVGKVNSSSMGSEGMVSAHQDKINEEIILSETLLTGESHKENYIETFRGNKKGEGNMEDRILREVTTKINRVDISTREDIGVKMNTNSAPSYTPVKTGYRDQKDFLPVTSGI